MASDLVDKARKISAEAKSAGRQKFDEFLAGGLKSENSMSNGNASHAISNGLSEEQKDANAEGSGDGTTNIASDEAS